MNRPRAVPTTARTPRTPGLRTATPGPPRQGHSDRRARTHEHPLAGPAPGTPRARHDPLWRDLHGFTGVRSVKFSARTAHTTVTEKYDGRAALTACGRLWEAA
ncbi:hypothetical protein C6Y14_30845 [Streptomyces dioscori]|uniref:Uncharacterized protein n=1 Tax=Streptomyces dioscori TaxID=2109333 RepID=A0A2P8PZZ4_9ACTN|nr:hypothetical protein C6Y14_30845 [Streptomyces dioscori]